MSATRVTWFLIAISFLISSAGAQVVPAATMAPDIAVFAEGSINALGFNPDPARYGALYGGMAGGYLQTRPWLGIEARALFLESASEPGHEEHQRAAFLGPRFAMAHNRLSVDGVLLAGVAHSDYPASPVSMYPDGQDVLTPSTKPALDVGGGLDLRLSRRFSWRAAEVTYGHVFGRNEPQGVTFSSGLILRLFR